MTRKRGPMSYLLSLDDKRWDPGYWMATFYDMETTTPCTPPSEYENGWWEGDPDCSHLIHPCLREEGFF